MRTLTIICDCCRKEIAEDKVFKIEHYIHVSPSFNRLQGHSEIIDGMEAKDFCLPCYNEIFSKVFEHIKNVRG